MKRRLVSILLFFSLGCLTKLFAQEMTVRGVVTDLSGLPISGVNIVVKGSSRGLQTDLDGKYRIDVQTGDVLVFSFIGFKSVERIIGAEAVIHVIMEEDVAILDEVVVTAMGIKEDARKLTYAAQNVKNDELNLTQSTNFRDALAGKVAGVEVKSPAGSNLSSRGEIYLRGAASLGGRRTAIYVVDGVISDPDVVDVENIESINVLKGANATALYGLEGLGGVIVITTKSGKKNSVNVELFNSTTFDLPTNFLEYQDEYGQGYSGEDEWAIFDFTSGAGGGNWGSYPPYFVPLDGLRYNQAPYADESWGPKFDGQSYAPWYAWFPGTEEDPNPYYGKTALWKPNKDNVMEFWDTGITTKTGVSISGGGENYTGRLSYTRHDISGLIPKSERKANLFNGKFDLDLSEKLNIGVDFNYQTNSDFGDFWDFANNSYTGAFNNWFARDIDMGIMKELKNLKTPEGYSTSWNWWGPDIYTLSYNFDAAERGYMKPVWWFNPYWWAEQLEIRLDDQRLTGSLHAEYKISEAITINSMIATRSNTQKYEELWPYAMEYSSAPAVYNAYVNSFSEAISTFSEIVVRTNALFKVQLIRDVSLRAIIGADITGSKWNKLQSYMTLWGHPSSGELVGLVIPDLWQFSNSRESVIPQISEQKIRTNLYYGRFNFSYKDYLNFNADLSLVSDSRFDTGIPNEHGKLNDNTFPYGSIGASFNFSNVLDWEPLYFGKLSVNYAKVGALPPNLQPTYFVYNRRTYNNNPLMDTPDTVIDSDIKPLTSGALELSTDLAFLDNAIRLKATYYTEDRKDQIISLDLPSASGYTNLITNSGQVLRKGLELTLGLTPVKNNDFNWDINLNYAKNKSTVKAIGGDLESERMFRGSLTDVTNRVGEEWGQLIGKAITRNEEGIPVLNPNGTYRATPGHNFGTVLPKFNGGVFNKLTYKNLSLSATITYQNGGKFFAHSEYRGSYSGLARETAGLNDLGNPKRDQPSEGGGIHSVGIDTDGNQVDTYVDAQTYFKSFDANGIIEPFVHDASYIKLSELSINYHFSKKLLGDFMEGATIGVIGRNLWLISTSKSNAHNWDPSQFTRIFGESGTLPGTTSLGFTIKLSF